MAKETDICNYAQGRIGPSDTKAMRDVAWPVGCRGGMEGSEIMRFKKIKECDKKIRELGKKLFNIKCPYCGFENLRLLQTKAYYNKKIITCDEDEGGCGRSFVLDIIVKYEQKTLKIEGEQ